MKTIARQEQTATDVIMTKELEQIHTTPAPNSLASYMMAEVDDDGIITHALEEIPYTHGFAESGGAVGTSSMTEVERFLSPTSDMEGIVESDIVELAADPFKGERAHIQCIDETEGQATVELYGATVPISVTVHGDQIRVPSSEKR